MPNTRPRIVFDDQGICNGCNHAEAKKSVDWNARRNLFLELVEKLRVKNGSYDCIVPGSGGKDSFYVAHKLKYEYGMHPLTCTFAPHLYTTWGQHNFYAWLNEGFSNYLFTSNPLIG
mgnify:CR=1 FL=1